MTIDTNRTNPSPLRESFPSVGVPLKKAGYYLYRAFPFVKGRGQNLLIGPLRQKLQAQDPHSYHQHESQR
jgi:hypothetical protein